MAEDHRLEPAEAAAPAEPHKPGGGCAAAAVSAGDVCPVCRAGRLDYDGMLNLFCPVCGRKFNGGGAFT